MSSLLVKTDADPVGITVAQLGTLHSISINPNIGLGELAEKLKSTNSTVIARGDNGWGNIAGLTC